MEKVTLKRKELYDLVWSTPLSHLAKKYQISDNGLRKICKRMNIPIPAMGHWQKLKFGKNVVIQELPENFEGKDDIIIEERGSDDAIIDSPFAQQKKLIDSIENTKSLSINVPDRLSSRPDKLITDTINYFDAVRRYYKSHRGYYPDRNTVLNIEVRDETLPRALRLLDTIIKALKARGHEVETNHFTTDAIIGAEHVEFRLREKKRMLEVKDNYGSRQYEFTGELVFVIDIGPYRRKEIKDGHEPIETKVSTIIAALELEGQKLKEERIQAEIYRIKREEQERIEREYKELQRKDLQAFKQLFLDAIRLHQTNILRTYIQTIEEYTNKKGELTEEFLNWKTWADKKVLWYDPLMNESDPLLTDKHKTDLFRDFLREW